MHHHTGSPLSSRRKLLSALFTALLSASACGPEGLEPTELSLDTPPETELGTVEQQANAHANRLWIHPTLPVCYENPSAANAAERGWMRDAIARTWEQVSRLRFTGWGTCQADWQGIKIIFSSEHTHAGIARGHDGRTGIKFNLAQFAGSNYESQVRFTIVHEFGHVLGFGHEHDRKDKPANSCPHETGSLGSHLFGPYDAHSVMNYCSPFYGQWRNEETLSPGDIRAIHALYGAKPGMLVSDSGKCADVVGFGTANGTPVHLWHCHGATNQQWNYTPGAPSNFVSVQSQKRLDDPGASNTPGRQLQIWEKASYFNAQQFDMNNTMIRGLAGQCLDVAGGINRNGTEVWSWGCHGGWPQRWTLEASGRIRNQAGKCLEVAGGQKGNGARIQVWDCWGGAQTPPNQGWYMENGSLKSRVDNRCLDVNNVNPNNGAKVTLWDCHGGVNQRWNFRGNVLHGNTCLTARGGSAAAGTPLEINNCGLAGQEWDYHF